MCNEDTHRDAGAAVQVARTWVTATPEWDAQADARGVPSEKRDTAIGTMTFDRRVHLLFDEASALLLSKHADYGPTNISRAPGGPLSGLRVRMWDKTARLNHLLDKADGPVHESLEDTLLDLLNYSAIAIMVLRGQWPDA